MLNGHQGSTLSDQEKIKGRQKQYRRVTDSYKEESVTRGCELWPVAWILPRYPSQFLSTTHQCGTAHSATAASLCHTASECLSTYLCVSAPPTCLDERGVFKFLVVRLHTAQFSDKSGCCSFWALVVILSVVVWEGEACSPMLPSWLEVLLCKDYILINHQEDKNHDYRRNNTILT